MTSETSEAPAEDIFAPLFAITDRKLLVKPENKVLAARLLRTDESRWEEYLEHLKAIKIERLREYEQGVRSKLKSLEKAAKAKARQKEQNREDGFIPDEFLVDENGNIARRAGNIRLALQKMDVHLAWNDFSGLGYVRGYRGVDEQKVGDEVMNDLWVSLDDRYGFSPTKDQFGSVLAQTARLTRYHPVRDYLSSLKWDGQPRAERWLHTYMGAEDSLYTRTVGMLLLKGAVKRAFEPGCKFDQMLVFCGKQGLGKSTAVKKLCPDEVWFTDSVPIMETEQKIIESTRGKWLVEISDMRGSSKAEDGAVKAQLSRDTDRARMAYARMEQDVPRQFVFFGTSNLEQFLTDPTGNRRYWPVMCGPVGELPGCDIAGLEADRDQIWAEVMFEYGLDPDVTLDPSLYPVMAEAQQAATKENPFEGKLASRLDHIDNAYIWAESVWDILGISVERRAPHLVPMGAAMKALGWEPWKKKPKGSRKPRVAYRIGDGTRLVVVGRDVMDGGVTVKYADEIVEEPERDDE